MFTIQSEDLVNTLPNLGDIPTVVRVEREGNVGITISPYEITNPDTREEIVLPITITNTTETISLPEFQGNITAIEYNGEILTPIDNGVTTIPPGRFTVDYQQRIATISFSQPLANLNLASIRLYVNSGNQSSSGLIKTNLIPLPYDGFLSQYNFAGEISITRSFQGHPTAELSLIVKPQDINSIREEFTRNNLEIDLEGMRFFVNSIQETIFNPKVFPQGYRGLNISLLGKWGQKTSDRSPLDRQIRVTGNTGGISTFYNPQGIPIIGAQNPFPMRQVSQVGNDTILLSRVANLAGVNYRGREIEINLSPGEEDSILTLREELETRAITINGFIYYSNPEAVEIKTWGATPIHNLLDKEIISEQVNIESRGHGTKINGVRLTEEFRNRLWLADNNLNNNVNNIEENTDDFVGSRQVIWEFEGGINFAEIRVPFDNLVSNNSVLRDVSNCFDNGGQTKKARRNIIINGTVVQSTEFVYGYAFSSDEVHRVSLVNDEIRIGFDTGISRGLFWQLVESHTTRKFWNQFGYITAEVVSGFRLVRFKQEQNREAATLQGEILLAASQSDGETQALKQAEQNLYRYFRSNIRRFTNYDLADLRNFYSDVQVDANGIPPIFATQIVTTEDTLEVTPDPTSSLNPELTTGRRFIDRTLVNITRRESPEKFIVTNYTQSNEGERFRNTLRVSNRTENSGRPSIHNRVNIASAGRNINGIRQQIGNQTADQYLLNTPDSGTNINTPHEGTITFPGIVDANRGRNIAETLVSIENSLNSQTVTLEITYRDDLQEGDLLNWRGEIWVIIEINQTRSISRGNIGMTQQPLMFQESFKITLGRFLDVSVSLTRVN